MTKIVVSIIYSVSLYLFHSMVVSAQTKALTIDTRTCLDCYSATGKAVKLAKPKYPAKARIAKIIGRVGVVITISQSGKVVKAVASSGNRVFWPNCEMAALHSQFQPPKFLGKPVSVVTILFYNFVQDSSNEARSDEPTEEPKEKLPIVNGKASYLPKPIYSEEANRFCADGKVEVEVLIGEDGKVITAKAISGDELLQESSVTAAKMARFRLVHGPPVRVTGKLVYNFDHLSKCIKSGIANKKALSIPKPVGLGNILHPSHLRLSVDAIINVNIVINESGNVISARATSGHPLLRNAFESSARGAKFSPTNFGPVKVKAILSYRLKPNGEMEY